jgi:hypothetical protein
MKTVLIAGITALLLATSTAWPSRPTIPGDQFQLATVAQKQAIQDDGAPVQTQLTVGKGIMATVAKGEGWM